MVDKVLRVGLVGFGVSAKYMHAPFLVTNPLYNVIAVFERHANESRSLFPEAKIVRNYNELLNIDEIDLIIITTPNDTHRPYALQALEAGKHVVVEKPFTITSDDAQVLIDAYKRAGKVLSVYQNRRYVSDFLTIKQIVQNNLLGNIHEVQAHYDRFRPEARPGAWRETNTPGSGILYDLGAHLIDQALCLFGLPHEIFAEAYLQRPHAKAVDNFFLRLYYSGLTVTLKGGMLVREPGPRYQLHGALGSFIKYGEDPQEVFLRAGKLPVSPDWGMEDASTFGLLHTEQNGKILKENYPSAKGNYGFYYNNLYNTIVRNSPNFEQPEHGFNTIRLIELAMQSAQLNKTIPCLDLKNVAYPGMHTV